MPAAWVLGGVGFTALRKVDMLWRMCGRYYRRSDKQRIAEAFKLAKLPPEFILSENYNVTPTTFQPVIRADKETAERELIQMRWGLVPRFAKSLDAFKGVSTINAKAETVQTSGMWRTPFARHRCLVPADGFYEWKKLDPKTKQPYAFTMRDGSPFAFAGLWDAWRDPDGGWLQSFSIITTTPNELTATVHSRMPVILRPDDYGRWLSREETDKPPIDLLRPFDAGEMMAHPVDPRVGNVRNNEPGSMRCVPVSAELRIAVPKRTSYSSHRIICSGLRPKRAAKRFADVWL